jgi:hypothetical protein
MSINYEAFHKVIAKDDVQLMQFIEIAQGVQVTIGLDCGDGANIFLNDTVFCIDRQAPKIAAFLKERQKAEFQVSMPITVSLCRKRNAMNFNRAIDLGLYPSPES